MQCTSNLSQGVKPEQGGGEYAHCVKPVSHIEHISTFIIFDVHDFWVIGYNVGTYTLF